MYGNPETTTGGRALKFYASVRIDIRKASVIKNGNDIVGNKIRCKVVKNKLAPPFKIAEFEILYGSGISKSSEIIDIGVTLDVIQKSGSWFSYGEQRLAQGKDNARKYIESNPELFAEIEAKVREKLANVDPEQDFEVDEEDDLDVRDFELGDDL